jgi:hypothetical protein
MKVQFPATRALRTRRLFGAFDLLSTQTPARARVKIGAGGAAVDRHIARIGRASADWPLAALAAHERPSCQARPRAAAAAQAGRVTGRRQGDLLPFPKAPTTGRTDIQRARRGPGRGQGARHGAAASRWGEAQSLAPGLQGCRHQGPTFHDLRGTRVTAPTRSGRPKIAAISGHTLKAMRSILDANALHRDPQLAAGATRNLEARTKFFKPDKRQGRQDVTQQGCARSQAFPVAGDFGVITKIHRRRCESELTPRAAQPWPWPHSRRWPSRFPA